MHRLARYFFPLPCALLALLLIAVPLRAQQPLKIMTFNVECLQAPGVEATKIPKYRWDAARRAQFERAAAVIETIEPDIINLLEVTSKEAVDYLVEILHEKGYKDYRGYHVESADAFTGFDAAVITRFPCDTVEGQEIRILLAGDDRWREPFTYTDSDGKERKSTTTIVRHAVYYITVGEYKLGFAGLHLKSNPDDAYSNARREAEATIAQRIIRDEIVGRGYTPIVLGDLNDYDADVPDRDDTRDTKTTVIAKLKHYDASQSEPQLVNVAERIPRVADRYTSHWDRNENGAADPGDVFTMIDHILLPREFMPHVKRAFIGHIVTLDTSDHKPVVVELALP